MRVILTNSLLKYYLLIKRRITNKLARNNKYKEINKVAKGTVLMREEKVKIIPLGGLGEIGKNITVFECDDEIIVVDCGIAFPPSSGAAWTPVCCHFKTAGRQGGSRH